MTPPEPIAVDGGGTVFAEPWQARVFALVVALCEDGRYDWDAFRDRLIAEIGAADDAGDETTGYYEHWLAACEKLLAAEGLAGTDELAALKAHLAAHPPHPTEAKPNPVAVDPARPR